MRMFTRPSREELRRVEDELVVLEEIREIMGERAQSLNEEISKLDVLIKQNRDVVVNLRAELINKLDHCVKDYGILGLKRLSLTCRESLFVDIKQESVLGVRYDIPFLITINKTPYSINRSNELVDNVMKHNLELLQALINYSKYNEARKKMVEELYSIKRRLNSIKNILLKELGGERKKILNFLLENERFEWVMKHKTISLAREQELFK